jgi:hypothetical protein
MIVFRFSLPSSGLCHRVVLQLTISISEAAGASETLLAIYQTEPETIIKVIRICISTEFIITSRRIQRVSHVVPVVEVINAYTLVGRYKKNILPWRSICNLENRFRWVGSMTEN